MNDRALLEYAAKAAGLKVVDNRAPISLYVESEGCKGGVYWNPLADDGDALRLAVRLGICFGPNFDGDLAVCFGNDGRNITEQFGKDPYASTRRAIVRAAAEIGKAMS